MDRQKKINGILSNALQEVSTNLNWWEVLPLLLKDLDKADVVIKVDRELPDCPIPRPQGTMDEGYNNGYEKGFKVGVIEMLENTGKAGYVAVIPLIETIKHSL